MSIRTIALTFILFLGFTFSNCNSDDCGGNALAFFDIKTLISPAHYLMSKDQPEELAENTLVTFDEYAGLKLEFVVDFIALAPKSSSNDFSLIPSITACTPLHSGWEGSKTEKFSAISVTTLLDFDDNHSANSNINDLINIRSSDFDGTLAQQEDLTTFLAKNELISSAKYFLKIKSPPNLSDALHLKVQIELSTGEVFEETAPMINISN